MRHYRIPVAIAVGLATALAAGGHGRRRRPRRRLRRSPQRPRVPQRSWPSTAAARSSCSPRRPAARSTRRSTTRCSTGSSIAHAGRARRVQGSGRRRGVQDRARPRRRRPEADRRRQDVDVHAAQGHQVLQRQAGAGARRAVDDAAHLQGAQPTAGGFYSVLVGADKCLKTPATCDLSKSRRGRRRRRTRSRSTSPQPDAEWLDKLAVPHANLLPWGTPNKDFGTKLPPSTGAVHVHEVRPEPRARARSAIRTSRSGRPTHSPTATSTASSTAFGQTVEAQITQIENGTADWTLESPPADRLNEIGTKYASQAHINTQFADWYLPMNVNIPPFNNKLARQAVNYAVDRNAAVRIFGGPKLAIPSCQILPPGFPAYARLLPVHEEPGRQVVRARPRQGQGARQAVGHGGPEGRRRRPGRRGQQGHGRVHAERAELDRLQGDGQGDLRQHPVHLHPEHEEQGPDLASRSGTRTIRRRRTSSTCCSAARRSHPGSDSSINIAGYCNKKIDAEMKKALKLGITDPDAALKLWTKIDQRADRRGRAGSAASTRGRSTSSPSGSATSSGAPSTT